MAVADIFAFIGLVLKLALIVYENVKQTPVEKRREAMAEFDEALNKAREKKDLGDLSKWFGKRL
jgi:uncharacterized membrane protein (DUF106 family)